ncbi:hypothetical protein [Azospirillum largimobile]
MNSEHGFFPSIRHPATAGLPPKAGAIGRRTPRENWRLVFDNRNERIKIEAPWMQKRPVPE